MSFKFKLSKPRNYGINATGTTDSPIIIRMRDQKIKVMYAKGYTDSVIAQTLKISPSTVKTWRDYNNKPKNPKTK